VPRITPAFRAPVHLAPLLATVAAVERGPVRACLSVPPRHSKTETVLHAIAWLLARHPDWTIGYVSYAADIARSKSRQARDYAARAGLSLRDDSAALHEWRTPEGGGLLATGVGGPLTGHGVRVLIVDDPFKNREEADSALVREKVHAWFTSTAMTRVEPGGSVLVVHTRWHRDDLIGRLSRDTETPWQVTNLPALDSDGAALWPARWSADDLARRRAEVGEYDWASLYQGHPVAKKGRVYPAFDRATHVLPHAEIERRFKANGRWSFRRTVGGVDFGWSHPGALVVLGQTGTGDVYALAEEHHSGVLVAERNGDGRPGWLAIFKRAAAEYGLDRFAADPSEPGNITSMRLALGNRPLVENADNGVAEGIRRLGVLLALRPDPRDPAARPRPRFYVSDRCPRLVEELETYSYRTVGGATSETPQEVADDCADAARYAICALTTPALA
jgi:hypothetical protein